MTIDKLLEKTNDYCTPTDQKAIKLAYEFAQNIHKHETRGTGGPYIQHPLKVAYYLAENELDPSTIIGALLHDTEETNPKISSEISKIFGSEVADLVEGVTKLGKIKIKKSWFLPFKFLRSRQEKQLGFQRHLESLRKMLLAMSKDIRVILIKFADRLHNMQTLEGVRPDKQRRIAQETLEIYAPIAHRLGMGKLKGTLEDLSFPYVYPKEYEMTKQLAGKSYQEKEKVCNKAQEIISKVLIENHINSHIDGRKKHLYSLWKKLTQHNNDINKIYDIIAVRIVVDSIEECYKVLGLIHKTWRPLIGRIKDYIAVPKPNGYQSLHTTIFGPDGEILEIQIRTNQMHYNAEYGIAAHWHYAQKNKSAGNVHKGSHLNDKLTWLDELAKWQEAQTDENELLNGLNLDFFKDRIFVFTPQGDIHDLPANSSPVDFAYSIHTEVGNKCIGAKVNGKIVKLDYSLNNGDIVDIITKSQSKPKRDWLRFVKTQRARSKIKSFITKNSLILGK